MKGVVFSYKVLVLVTAFLCLVSWTGSLMNGWIVLYVQIQFVVQTKETLSRISLDDLTIARLRWSLEGLRTSTY